jgi:hypothetical protein
LSGPGIVAGRVKLEVAARGRVVRSVRISFTCQTRSAQTTSGFAAAPAYEFIRPDGRFYSPLNGNAVGRHPTTWAGRFTVAGVLGGTLSIHDPCTRRPVHATFRGRVASSGGRPSHGSRPRD